VRTGTYAEQPDGEGRRTAMASLTFQSILATGSSLWSVATGHRAASADGSHGLNGRVGTGKYATDLPHNEEGK
jgi:hypothetical protein